MSAVATLAYTPLLTAMPKAPKEKAVEEKQMEEYDAMSDFEWSQQVATPQTCLFSHVISRPTRLCTRCAACGAPRVLDSKPPPPPSTSRPNAVHAARPLMTPRDPS